MDISGEAMTISAWVQSDQLNNCPRRSCRIISKADPSRNRANYWLISTIKKGNKTRLRFKLKTDRGSTKTLVARTGNIENGERFHVTAVYNGQFMELYKNGELVGKTRKIGQIDTNNLVNAWIGGNPVQARLKPWLGNIQDVRIYSRALSQTEINSIIDESFDTTAPLINNIQTSVSDNLATITWETDEPASSEVAFGLDASYSTGTVSDAVLKTSHSLTLTGLTQLTDYHFQINSTDSSGNSGSSGDETLTTLATPDTTAPQISNILVSVTDTTATISWETDEPASSEVAFGLDTNYSDTPVTDTTEKTSHSLTLSGLTENTQYYYVINSTDSAGNTGTQSGLNFITDEAPLPIPELVKDINQTLGQSSDPIYFTEFNGMFYFSAYTSENGRELWKSDGTEAGTVMVKDINLGVESSIPDTFININGTLYFIADDGVHGDELWKTDGTEAGTVMVADINEGQETSQPMNFTKVNETLYFRANDGVHGRELWKSDGTKAGTVMVADINTLHEVGSLYGSDPYEFTNVNGILYFVANDGVHGYELWKSDGTEAGTMMVADIDEGGNAPQRPSNFTNFNNTLYFSANDGVHGEELWKSDGTEAGTVMVADFYEGEKGLSPFRLIVIKGTLYFSGYDLVYGKELWKSDGTELGTEMVADISPGLSSSFPSELTNVDGILYFVADDGVHDDELWKSDGTEAGTVRLTDKNVTNRRNTPRELTNVNGMLYFSAVDESYGRELWKSDGTEAGTVMVADINEGENDGDPESLIHINGILYFSAHDGVHGYELWKLQP